MGTKTEELDKLSLRVAEEVLGRPECEMWSMQSVSPEGPVFIKVYPCGHDIVDAEEKVNCRPLGVTPNYSRNLGACEEVIDHLVLAGCDLDLVCRGGGWHVLMVAHEGSTMGPSCSSLAEAICLAALSAKEKL